MADHHNYALTFKAEGSDPIIVVITADHVPTTIEIVRLYVRNWYPWHLVSDDSKREHEASVNGKVDHIMRLNGSGPLEVRPVSDDIAPKIYRKKHRRNTYEQIIGGSQ